MNNQDERILKCDENGNVVGLVKPCFHNFDMMGYCFKCGKENPSFPTSEEIKNYTDKVDDIKYTELKNIATKVREADSLEKAMELLDAHIDRYAKLYRTGFYTKW